MTPTIRLPLFRRVYFQNLSNTSKKSASVSVRIMHATRDILYVQKVQSTNTIVGFQDPDTGFFITKLRNEDTQTNLAHNQFRQKALEYAQIKVDELLTDLTAQYKQDKQQYKDKYKPLDQINNELSEYLADANDFFADLEKQVALVRSNARPHINEYVAYQDDDIGNDMYVTEKVPYLNPMKQINSKADDQLVENFLSVFLDADNRDILAWYFGAMLSNLPIYDERISKMMVVSSAHGGSGKSTLLQSLSNALLTEAYREIKSSFDNTFAINNRFGTSQILPVRLVLYGEAEFNEVPNGDHNFDGLNVSELKSMISDGYVAYEKKYADMQTTRLSSFHIVLTNNPPTIDEDRQALNRRLLPLIVKPNSMAEKGLQLQLDSEQQIYQFVNDHVQAFANYFVRCFNDDPKAWTSLEYNHQEVTDEIQDGEEALVKAIGNDRKALNQLKEQSIHTVFNILGQHDNLPPADIKRFLSAVQQAKGSKDNPDIRWDNDKIYISSTRRFFTKYHLLVLRKTILEMFGKPRKKFGQLMWGFSI